MSQIQHGDKKSHEGYQVVQIGPEKLEIPEEWTVTTVSDVASRFISGGTPDSSNEDYWGGKIPWTTAAVVEGPQFEGEKDFITQEGLENSSASLVPKGSILFGTRVNVANIGRIKKDIAISQDLTGIVLDYNTIDPDFVTWHLLFNESKIRCRYSQGSTIQGMLTDDLKSLPLLSPTLPEQRRIAEILSTVDEKIQQTDEIIVKRNEVRTGLMQDLLFRGIEHETYQTKQVGPKQFEIPQDWTLSNIGSVTNRLRNGIAEKQNHDGIGIPVTRIETISEGFVDTDKIGWMDIDEESHRKFKLQRGDIMFSHKNSLEHLGKSAQFQSDERLYHGENLLLLRPDEGVVFPRFAYFFLNTETIRSICRSFAKKSVSQVSLNQKEVSGLPMPIPPMDEQKKIARILDTVEEGIREEMKYKQHLQELKRGLMQDLLTGKVRVKTN